jgi:arylsulfatase A-like enzyme
MEPHVPYVPIAGGRARFAAAVPRSFDARKPGNYSWELLESGFSESGERRTDSVVPPQEQAWIRDLYDGCVWSADAYLGEILARLEELGLTGSTIEAVTSDHGEELFDHGLLMHSNTLYRELVRVPLVLAGPGIPRGERVSAVLSNAGLAPTLARLGGSSIEGLSPAAEAALDLLRPGADGTVLFSTRQGWWNGVYRQPLFGLRRGSSVLHFAPQGAPWGDHTRNGKGETRLYDLARDPGEETDLAALEPERAHALLDELLTRLAGFETRRVETGGAVDEGTLDVLRELGYVGK